MSLISIDSESTSILNSLFLESSHGDSRETTRTHQPHPDCDTVPYKTSVEQIFGTLDHLLKNETRPIVLSDSQSKAGSERLKAVRRTKLGVAVTPEELKDTPVRYLGQDIVLCSWSAKIWSQYHFDFDTRPLYKVPMTGGFAKGVTAVHVKLEGRHKQKKIVTAKPFLCITSRGDDVLKAAETTSRADYIGPNRDEVELNDNVFLSQDCGDTAMAIDMVKCWMKGKHFL